MKNRLILIIAAGLTIVSCETAKETATEVTDVAVNSATNQTIDLDYLNTEVRPQDDFFEFSNGSWIKNNPVPPSESRWGSFNELDKSNKGKLTSILEAAKGKAANSEKGSMDQLLGDYYASYINMDNRNDLSHSPILDEIKDIKNMNSKNDLVKMIMVMHKAGMGPLFHFGVGQDLKNVEKHIAYLSQGGIGLPNKEYYFDEDKAEILTNYNEHISKCFIACDIYDEKKSKEQAKKVIIFERQLAEVMMAPAELRVPENTYNKFQRKTALRMFGDFDFESYLVGVGIDSFDSLVIGQPAYIENIAKLVKDRDLETWKSYLIWNVVNHYAGHLDEEMVSLNFQFYGKVLRGKKEMKPLNERAIDEITGMPFAELLGKAFVEKHYSSSAQERVNTMVDNLLIVFEDRIENLEWMSDETKKEALIKLKSIGRKLGFPEKWEDFSKLDFKSDDYIHNIREASKYAYNKNIAKLGKKVDKDEWGMPAHMVNAYYHPLLNEIAFPAGIMQPPFFSDDYEDAVNYGRIGMVIGHEFTHGFDDMGSKFAADGSFNNWWSEADRSMFEERTEKLGNTYASFCPIDGHCVNPSLTMGENIADLGGLTLAFHAYKRTKEFKSGIKRKGYSPAQRFFIAYAQLWKINYTEEELKNRIANDPHSPGMFRVNGPLMNCPEFFEAFSVKEEDPMRNSSDKISRIW